jgi:DNA polymerase-3 subunit delta
MLAPARARMDHGQSLDAAMTSFGKSLFFRDKSMVAKLLRTWDAKGLATVAERTGRLERELMFGPAPDGPVLGEELLAIARSARGRR